MHNQPCFLHTFTLTKCSSGGSLAHFSRRENSYGLSWFWGEIIKLFFPGSKLSDGKHPRAVVAYSSVTLKTQQKHENPVSEQQSETEEASCQHEPGEI